jgi:hydroxymethylbilane synthase
VARLVIGTRGSALARAQTGLVADLLRARGHEVAIEVVVTRGDREQGRTVPELGGKGLFTAELEEALLSGAIDLAVHSLKDLPTEGTDGILVAAVPTREDARDAMVGARLDALRKGARVGTASLRRRALLLHRRPDLEVVPLRGNVDTRIRKAKDGEVDAVVLAVAGLKRLGRADAIADVLPFLGAPAQGALALQARADKGPVLEAVRPLHDATTARCVDAERRLLSVLEGGCSVPVGALAVPGKGGIHLRALVAAPDGRRIVEGEGRGEDPLALGTEVARVLLERGAREILDALS